MSRNAIVLSIRPRYVERIVDGLKTVELRRRFPLLAEHSAVLLYSTSPVQSIVGHAVLAEVVRLSPRALWRRFARAAAVTRDEFDVYFRGVEVGCALRLTHFRKFPRPIPLPDLERRFAFCPPQSFCYWREPLTTLAVHGRFKTLT